MPTLLGIPPSPQSFAPLSIGNIGSASPKIGIDSYCTISTNSSLPLSSRLSAGGLAGAEWRGNPVITTLFASGADSTDSTGPSSVGGGGGSIGGAGNSGGNGRGGKIILDGLRNALSERLENDKEYLLYHMRRQMAFVKLWETVAEERLVTGNLMAAHEALVDVSTIIDSLEVILGTKSLIGEAEGARETALDVNGKIESYWDDVKKLKKKFPEYFNAVNGMDSKREVFMKRFADYISVQSYDAWNSRDMLTAAGNGEAIQPEGAFLLRPKHRREDRGDEEGSVDRGDAGDKVDRTGDAGDGGEEVDRTGGGDGWENPDSSFDPLGIAKRFMDDIGTALQNNDIGTIRGRSDAILRMLPRIKIEGRSLMIKECMERLLELEGSGK